MNVDALRGYEDEYEQLKNHFLFSTIDINAALADTLRQYLS